MNGFSEREFYFYHEAFEFQWLPHRKRFDHIKSKRTRHKGAEGQDEWPPPSVAPTKYFLVGQQMGLYRQMSPVIGLASRLMLLGRESGSIVPSPRYSSSGLL